MGATSSRSRPTSARNAHVTNVVSAKTDETRTRRIAAIVAKLA
ncbi:YdeI/OmpD-associated family protein [Microbacterium hominis]|nr:YdeI/OmpD-associated family protein [Microbacterium hominis]